MADIWVHVIPLREALADALAWPGSRHLTHLLTVLMEIPMVMSGCDVQRDQESRLFVYEAWLIELSRMMNILLESPCVGATNCR